MRISDWSSDVCSSDLEQRIFSLESHRPDGPFGGVVVEFDPAVVEEAGEATPALQCIFHCVARRRAGHDAGTGGDEPGVELVDQRTASLLSDSEALLGRIPSDFLLDEIGRASCRASVCQYV